jgi:DNA-binding NtrC family response regulator
MRRRVGFQQLLTSWGYTVEAAADGEEALPMIPEFRPDIVLSDLVMPRLDGLGLLRALQQERDGVTTVTLTAQGTVDTAVEALKQGATITSRRRSTSSACASSSTRSSSARRRCARSRRSAANCANTDRSDR